MKYPDPLHIFLISSPLQALVAAQIIEMGDEFRADNCIIFPESTEYNEVFRGYRIINIENTRLDGKKYIKDNIKKISTFCNGRLILWVSDIFWPMNNAFYTFLLNKNMLSKVNFFDEGIVLYWQEHLPFLSKLREGAKCLILSRRLGVDLTAIRSSPFYDNRENGEVYALHPHLLTRADKVRKIDVNIGGLDMIAAGFDGDLFDDRSTQPYCSENSAVVLSQPYYRVANEGQFTDQIEALASLLRERGHQRLFVKLHPSEGVEQFDKYYRRFGFEVAFDGMKAPVEAVLHRLPASTTLASFNSSALLNARKFGFEGNILSFGLNWVAAQYPIQRSLFSRTHALFEKSDLEIVLS